MEDNCCEGEVELQDSSQSLLLQTAEQVHSGSATSACRFPTLLRILGCSFALAATVLLLVPPWEQNAADGGPERQPTIAMSSSGHLLQENMLTNPDPWECSGPPPKGRDGFEHASDHTCTPLGCKTCRRPAPCATCSVGFKPAPADLTAAQEVLKARVKAAAPSAWCMSSVPTHPVEDLMVEFQRVDKIMRLVAGGPNGRDWHSYTGYHGPWIENHFISYFYHSGMVCSPQKYVDTFGPFVPIFAQWVDTMVGDGAVYAKMVDTLEKVLDPRFRYVTVTQSDAGVGGGYANESANVRLQRLGLVVLSGGGYGDVPIPLLKQPENALVGPAPAGLFSPRFLGFAGSIHFMREQVIATLRKERANEHEFDTYYGPDWRWFWGTCKYCLMPRGYGRSAFAIYEIIQLNRCVPVYVYDDVEWLPYLAPPSSDMEVRDWIVSVKANKVAEMLPFLQKIPESTYQRMRARLSEMRESHFMYDGMMHQIQGFMAGTGSDLKCRPLPPTLH
eukprot:TRINITY_DN1052_c1_g1_i4.p1 TRINITY_DN1052_c1_g1~~TRINITY_DN1052_c1_g1_i4.p1  ORF type:complete len:503 (-),score=91.55 TRINITY_DN1052_c1_g1_i4:99-1607(-)